MRSPFHDGLLGGVAVVVVDWFPHDAPLDADVLLLEGERERERDSGEQKQLADVAADNLYGDWTV